MRKISFAIFLGIVLTALAASKAPPPLVSMENDVLLYRADTNGNRVPDFSTCGYACGDKDIPNVPLRAVVAPVKGDETARIQSAIDYVAGLAPDADGVRGAVLLLSGRHEV